MKPGYLALLLLVFSGTSCFAQQDKVVIRFIDTAKNRVLSNVTIMDKGGVQVAHTDLSGYAVLSLSAWSSSGYVFAFSPGYKLDTLWRPVTTVYLQPLSASLHEAVIRGNKVNRLLHAPDEYVVDYDFINDKILVATYSGNTGGHAKLTLLNKDGVVLTTCKIPPDPVAIYKSCVGMYYCVYSDKFFPLTIEGDSIKLRQQYGIKLLEGLQQCECSVNGDLCYKLTDRNDFRITYGIIRKGETQFRSIKLFEEKDVADASFEEWMDILALLSDVTPANQSAAARLQFARLKWDRSAYANINMPMIATHDTLVIFDYFKKQLLFYNMAGDSIGHVPIHFDWRQSQRFTVLKDAATGKIYLHRHGNQNSQWIEELNRYTGETSPNKIQIAKPMAENVKIYNGDIYMLWQDNGGGTRQIFVQRSE